MVTANEPLFLETVSSEVRKTLVGLRLLAMRGQLGDALSQLDSRLKAIEPTRTTDRVALGLLWSELLHLNRQEEEALTIFRKMVEPHLSLLPTDAQFSVADNLSTLQMAMFSPEGATTFYHLVDRRRTANFDWSNPHDMLEAREAIEKEKYHDALPPMWRNLLRAHRQGSWLALRRAANRYGNLCLKLGALEEACHFIVTGGAEDEVELLAAAIIQRRDADLVRVLLRRVMTHANLRCHFAIACKLLAKIPDIIPDSEVASICEWLLPRCQDIPDRHPGESALSAAWKALRSLGHRLPPDLAKKAIGAALDHPIWQAVLPGGNRVIPFREEMIQAVNLLAHAAPVDYLGQVADATIPLAIERVQHDYGPVVNLLCNLASLGGPELKSKIGHALYPTGKPVNRLLAQVATFFGVEALSCEQWEAFARKVTEELRLTVQKVAAGNKPQVLPETLMTMFEHTKEWELHVTVQSGLGLEALARERARLESATVTDLIRAIVEMAANRDNVLSNREVLLMSLCDFADRADEALRGEVVRALEPLARGEVLESTQHSGFGETNNPLSFARTRTGTREGVQASAMVAIAVFSGSELNRNRRISKIISEGFVSPDAQLRQAAYAAARRLPGLSAQYVLPIIMGLRDPDPSAAVSAFAAFAERKEWRVTRPMWKLFLLAVRLASQSANVKLRGQAAYALREWMVNIPTAAIAADAETLLRGFASDVAFSVRAAANRGQAARVPA